MVIPGQCAQFAGDDQNSLTRSLKIVDMHSGRTRLAFHQETNRILNVHFQLGDLTTDGIDLLKQAQQPM